MHYKTVFVCSKDKTRFHIFYKYDKVGYVPTEVDFVYKGKRYTTIDVMNFLSSMKRTEWKRKSYTLQDWYDILQNNINKQKFVKLLNELAFLYKGKS